MFSLQEKLVTDGQGSADEQDATQSDTARVVGRTLLGVAGEFVQAADPAFHPVLKGFFLFLKMPVRALC